MVNARSRKLTLLLISVTLLFGCLVLVSDTFQFADRWLSDRSVKAYAATLTPDPDIVVLDINEESIEKMLRFAGAGRWPWPRSIHGELLEGLAPFKPEAIVFDVFFSEPDQYRPDSDAYFNEVIAELDFAYFSLLHLISSERNTGERLKDVAASAGLVATAHANKDARAHLLLPHAIDERSWRIGSINFSPDSDGVGRRYDLYRSIQGWRLPSLPAKVIADRGVALPPQQSILLRWKGQNAFSIPTFSYADIYQAVVENNTDTLARLTGKIIIVGSTFSGLHDIRETPISHQHPAVYIVATAIDNLLHGRYLSAALPGYRWLIGLVAILLVGAMFWVNVSFQHQLLLALLCVVVLSGLFVWVSNAVLRNDVLLAVATPVLLGISTFLIFALAHGLREHLERRQAISLFGRFVDPAVVESLIKSGRLDIENTSQQATLTVLFSDIRGFTTLSEQRSAAQIVTLLNAYFGRQVNIIFDHKGTLDKFIGDCIMAFWGAPAENTNQAVDAVNAALEMADELVAFRQTLPPDLQTFDVGIGIHTGPAVVGMIGSNERVDYTAIGDTVNLASRIEGLTKGKARILVSEDTKNACRDASGNTPFGFLYCGEFSVKGREEKVQLYQPSRKIQ